MVTIIDYGVGNLGSVLNMMKKINVPAEVTDDLNIISKASKLLLPGVGAFDAAMQKLTDTKLREILDKKVLIEKIPILGICLGMQLLTKGSEEGSLNGLGWIDAVSIKFPEHAGNKIPHMGWNYVIPQQESKMTKSFNNKFRFYFVHSYYVKVAIEENSLLKTEYGVTFDSALKKDNIYGAQFHPEKSLRFGMQFLKNFATI